MTSRSPRSRRTTRWLPTAVRTTLSGGLLAAVAGAAAADPPPAPVPLPVVSAPAPTQWAPFPQPGSDVKPLPQLTPQPAEVTPPAVPARVLSFQKPAGETVPAVPVARRQEPAQDPKPAPPPANPKKDEERKIEQNPAQPPKDKSDPAAALPIRSTALPDKRDIFRLDSDQVLERRILRELKKEGDPLPQGEPLVPPGTAYQPKTGTYPPSQATLEPNWVAHRPLYFEQPNPERGLWDAGLFQPVVSSAAFYKDVLFWPHNIATRACRGRYDVSAGKCLPGNPTPYYLYPPGFTAEGLLLEASTVTGLTYIFHR